MLVELFRNRPDLACELLAVCAGINARADHTELGSIDLSQVVSIEYRADAVVLLRDRDNEILSAVVVEVQLLADPGKLMSWPQYITALRARVERPVALLVVGRWARRPIETGHPGFALTPIVIELEQVPRVEDESAPPELAVLSAIAHPEVDVARAALRAIRSLPDERGRLYLDLIIRALPAEARALIEADMIKNYEYQSDFARKYYAQGQIEGKIEGRREALVLLATARFGELGEEDQAWIAAIPDIELSRLTVEIMTASDLATFKASLTNP